jgi:hypothetical protein
MIFGIIVLLIFIIMAILMFLRKLPALLALPLMAILIAVFGGIPFEDILNIVIGKGSVRLYEAYTVTMFGSMLSFLLQKSGTAESFIKKGAELAGDRPFSVSIIMLLLITLLFTTLGGLGGIIMVATIIMPVLSSVGLTSLTVAGIFLIGISIGGILNAGNWSLYINILKIPESTVKNYALILFFVALINSVIFLIIELWRNDQIRISKKNILTGSIFGILIIVLIIICSTFGFQNILSSISSLESNFGIGSIILKILYYLLILTGALILLNLCWDLIKKITGREKNPNRIKWYAYFIPIIPLILILVFQINFIASFIVGLFYGFLATYRKGSINLLTQSIIEGGASVIPAVMLMLGIGILLNAIIGPGGNWSTTHGGAPWPVLAQLEPLLKGLIPGTPISYLLVFTIAAPLALYRGPLNVWGLGYGLAAIMMVTGSIPNAAIMGMLLSVGQIQGVCDPTNTANVWFANELRVDVQKIMWNTLPYMWVLAFIGLVISMIMFF